IRSPWKFVTFIASQTWESISRSRRLRVMRKRYLSVLSLLVPAFLILTGYAVVKAQNVNSSAVKGGRWSDPATWSGRKVPGEGAAVTIDKGIDVVLDVTPPALH